MISRYSVFWVLWLMAGLVESTYGQVRLSPYTVDVQIGETQLTHAFAGGINSGQFYNFDADDDGDDDLIVFDRASETIQGYENVDNQYQFNPDFAHVFPAGLIHWINLVDYDCDGRRDLFTHSNLGVKVYRNEIGDPISWAEVASPLLSEGESGRVNMLFNASDVASISDLDADGDLDMLYFNFANGDFLEFHKNLSVERTGNCGLDFVRESQRYGSLEMCACDDFSFAEESCHEGARVQHLLGKSLLSLDYDSDGLMDLVIGQESCDNLNLLINEGDLETSEFVDHDNLFPTLSTPLDWPSFPAAYQLDINFDGQNEIVLAQNIRDDATGQVDLSQSIRIVTEGQQSSFLQNQMIDVGEAAFPAFVDINGDGQQDLVIGSRNASQSDHPPGLHYYQKTPAGFVFISDDLFGLRSLRLNSLVPQFVDMDSDGRADLVLSAAQSTGQRMFGYWRNNAERGVNVNSAEFIDLEVSMSRDDDYQLYDWDEDGLLDLLVGNVFGELSYYHNEGPTYNLVLQDQDVLDVANASENLNLSLAIGDVDEDGTLDLLTTRRNGAIAMISGVTRDRADTLSWRLANESEVNARLGRRSKPAVGIFDGQTVVAVGTLGGGVRLFNIELENDDSKLTLDIFPNPSPTGIYNFRSNMSGGSIQILDLAGNQLTPKIPVIDRNVHLDLSTLENGIYLVRRKANGRKITSRLLVY